MGGSKLGKLLLNVSRGASKVGRGLDEVFGENRTRPGDSFSMSNSRKRAANFTEKARSENKAGGILGDSDEEKDYFGEKSSDENSDRRFY